MAEVGHTFDNLTLARRLRTHYQSRLGQSWDTGNLKSPIGYWHAEVTVLRHRIIHGGYQPTRSEAVQALDATDGAVGHAKDQLFKRRQKYPRTSAMLFALEGLKERGVPDVELEDLDLDTWIRDFKSWVATIPSRFV